MKQWLVRILKKITNIFMQIYTWGAIDELNKEY